MSVTHGMNIEEVRALGNDLQTRANAIGNLMGTIERVVGNATWVGPDAARFKNEWWPEHRNHLRRVSQDLHGFGQSALNNAAHQDRVSGTGAAGEVSVGVVPGGPPSTSGPSPAVPAPGGQAGQPGGMSGSLPGSDRSWQEVQQAYETNSPGMSGMGMHSYGGNDGYDYQCTSWAKYRWRELGYEGDFGTSGGRTGNGWEMAAFNGGSTDTDPSLGAMASYGDGQSGSYGHVMIVEEVSQTADGPPRIRVSEMNVGDTNYEVGLPDEYSSDSWFVQNGDGSWSREGGRNVGDISFAGLPTS